MSYTPDQREIVRSSAIAFVVAAAVTAGGYYLLPPAWFGLSAEMAVGEQIAFVLKVDIPLFLWLAGCVRGVSKKRFHSPADIRGSAYDPPSQAIAIRIAVLQNSLEQTVLAFGAHLALAAVLRGNELILVPVLAFLFLVGRLTFAIGYAKRPIGRSFGMALTGLSIVFGYAVCIGLIISGR